MVEYSVSILRFNPIADEHSIIENYQLEWDSPPSVLEALERIKNEYDNSLAFRSSCGLGKCGSCSVRLNNQAVLACQTLLERTSFIAPIAGYNVIKDLVVDREDYESSLIRERVFYGRAEMSRSAVSPALYPQQFQELAQCIGCLICQSSCPSFLKAPAEFPGPAVFIQLSRMLHHPKDKGKRELTAWIDGISNCTACMTCEQVCPKGVHPFKNAILPLRATAKAVGLELPLAQEKIGAQFLRSGRTVPLDKEVVNNNILSHPAVDSKSPILLFLGCMNSNKDAEYDIKMLDSIAKKGLKVNISNDLICCGAPLLWVGHKEKAHKAIEHNLSLLESMNISQIWTVCPGCALMFETEYRQYWKVWKGGEMPFKVKGLSEILEYISLSDKDLTKDVVRVAYHTSCHGRTSEKKIISFLKSLSGIEFVELQENQLCCGGMSATSNPSLALEMSSQIINNACEAGAQVLLTSCSFCRNNLEGAVKRTKNKLLVKHLLSFTTVVQDKS